MLVYPAMFNKTKIVIIFYRGFSRNRRVEKEGVRVEKRAKKRGPQNMQVYPTMFMKKKGEKKERWVYPTMLMKTSMLLVLSYDVYENKWTYRWRGGCKKVRQCPVFDVEPPLSPAPSGTGRRASLGERAGHMKGLGKGRCEYPEGGGDGKEKKFCKRNH